MEIYLVVVHDTIVQSREYAVLVPEGSDPKVAKEKIAKGEFLTESEATTMETLSTVAISCEKVGETVESGRDREESKAQLAKARWGSKTSR